MTIEEVVSDWFMIAPKYRTKEKLIEMVQAAISEYGLCQTCKTPLSRDCPRCQRLWES